MRHLLTPSVTGSMDDSDRMAVDEDPPIDLDAAPVGPPPPARPAKVTKCVVSLKNQRYEDGSSCQTFTANQEVRPSARLARLLLTMQTALPGIKGTPN